MSMIAIKPEDREQGAKHGTLGRDQQVITGQVHADSAAQQNQEIEEGTRMSKFKVVRLALSGALLGVAAANAFLGVNFPGELLAGVLGAGGALVLMKVSAII
ncbi:hypothetical protein D9M68_712200 [compost metagenome]